MVTALPANPLSAIKQPPTQLAPLRLEVVGGEYDGRSIELLARKISIGSGQSCTLRLIGCGLKPVELFIIRGQRHTVVRNWSPGNQINGRAFDDTILHPGDRLSVGSVEFVVFAAESSATAPEDTDSSVEARAKTSSTVDYLPTQLIDDSEAEAINELNQVRAQVAELRAQLQTHNNDARNDLVQWQREREQWIDELADSRQQTIAANRNLDDITAQRDDLEEKLSLLEAQLEELADSQPAENPIDNDKIARLAEQVESEVAQREQLTCEVEQSNQRLAEMQQKYDAIRKAAEAATAAIGEAEDRIHELEAELATARSAQPTIVSGDGSSAEEGAELLARMEEIEAREKALAEKAEQLEEAAFKVELMKEEFEEERESLRKQAEQGGSEPAANSDEQERELVELLQLREQLDRQTAELRRREEELARRERVVQNSEFESPHTEVAPSHQVGEIEGESSHTIMLDGQEDSAMSLAQRFLNQPIENDRIGPTEEYSPDEPDESIDDALLSDDHDSAVADSDGDQYFTQADSAPPVSAADILKKYAGENLYDDLDDIEEPEPPAQPNPEPAASIAEDTPDSDGDDDSIREYMDQLMRRVSGESPRMPGGSDCIADEPRPNSEPALEPEPATEKPEAKEESFEIMASGEYTPRSSAPEKTDNLAKMREVAMTSAHSAISTASRRRRTQAAVIHMVMALAAAITGGLLISYQTAGTSPVRYVTAFAAFGISVWWTYRAISFAIGWHQIPTNSILGKVLNVLRPGKSSSSPDDVPANGPAAEIPESTK